MSTTHTETTVNGVDVDRLAKTIHAVREDAELGKFRFRADNHWLERGRNRSEISSFHGAGEEHTHRQAPLVLENDEPEVLLGDDRAPNPAEFILHALAGCLTSTLVYQAAARGIEIESIESSLEGDIDIQGFLGLSEDVRKGYQGIRVK